MMNFNKVFIYEGLKDPLLNGGSHSYRVESEEIVDKINVVLHNMPHPGNAIDETTLDWRSRYKKNIIGAFTAEDGELSADLNFKENADIYNKYILTSLSLLIDYPKAKRNIRPLPFTLGYNTLLATSSLIVKGNSVSVESRMLAIGKINSSNYDFKLIQNVHKDNPMATHILIANAYNNVDNNTAMNMNLNTMISTINKKPEPKEIIDACEDLLQMGLYMIRSSYKRNK